MASQTVLKACDVGDMLRAIRLTMEEPEFILQVQNKLSKGRFWANQMVLISFRRSAVLEALANGKANDSIRSAYEHVKGLPAPAEETEEREQWPKAKRGPKKGSGNAGRPPKGSATPKPKGSATPKTEPKAERFSWVRIAEGHGVVSGTDGRSRNAAKADIERIDPTAIKDKDADRVDAACLQIKAERSPEQVRQEVASKKETLAQTKQREFDKLVRQKHAQLQAEAQKAVREVSEHLLAERDEWANTQWRKMQEEKRRLEGMRARVERREKAANFFMSYKEWKLLELLTHEDKWPQLDRSRPEDAKRIDQLNRAFAIVQRMKEAVDPNTPIATLRDQGWEPVAPLWKQAKARPKKSQEARQ
jgi:hypothetical protein